MGCTNSHDENQLSNNENLMEVYMKVEREIRKEEQLSFAPSLGHAILKLEKVMSEIESLSNSEIDHNQDYHLPLPVTNKTNDLDLRGLENMDNSIKNVLSELHLANNSKLAAEHEEFIANLNRKALKYRRLYWLRKWKTETETEAERFSNRVQHLQKLYEQLDVILNKALGSLYQSKIETELDRIRAYRDALYSTELCWQDAIKFTQSASVFAQVGLTSWNAIKITTTEDPGFQLATETRNAIQEAAISIQLAQLILPTVQFPYCTSREVFAILQVIEYLYTDMQIKERYQHAGEVYKSFQKRSTSLSTWLKELMDTTIHKDLEAVDHKLMELVTQLNSERLSLIQKKGVKMNSNGITLPKSIGTLPEVIHTT